MASSTKRERSLSPLLELQGPLPLARAGPVVKRLKSDNLPEPEKRLALFKKACPQSVLERIERVKSQRFYCVHRGRTGGISELFKVLGSTGNVYDVAIGLIPRCSCPDGTKNGCFLKIPEDSNLYYQKALLSSELRSIFMHSKISPVDGTTARLAQIYKKATGQEVEEEKSARRLPGRDDSCPICYEDSTIGQQNGLVFCENIQGCGSPCHTACFAQWARTITPVTCVSCRAPWTKSVSNTSAGTSYPSEGYLNVAEAAGLNTVRDASSYYDGPRRGQPYKGNSRNYNSYGGYRGY